MKICYFPRLYQYFHNDIQNDIQISNKITMEISLETEREVTFHSKG